MDRYGDALAGAVCLILAGIALLATNTVESTVVVDPLGPAAYPRLLVLLFAGFSVVLLLQGIARSRRFVAAPTVPDEPQPPAQATNSSLTSLLPVAAILGLGVAYVAFLKPTGYLIATPALLLGLLLVLGARNPLGIVVGVAVMVAALYGLFGLVMGVPLP